MATSTSTTTSWLSQHLQRALALLPKYPSNLPTGQFYQYGTSGFRGLAERLACVGVRMGILTALKALTCVNEGRILGIMITASHNPEEDNGLKMIEPNGEMLEEKWEIFATQIANISVDEFQNAVAQIALQYPMDFVQKQYQPTIFIGRDTRPSSPELSKLVIEGIESLCVKVVDYGIITTPILHWLVAIENQTRAAKSFSSTCTNTDVHSTDPNSSSHPSLQAQAIQVFNNAHSLGLRPLHTTIESHYDTLFDAFKVGLKCRDNNDIALTPLSIDCSNGVGAQSILNMQKHLGKAFPLSLYNTATTGLNDHVGAEHVQKTKSLPKGCENFRVGDRGCSIDGDADRLVYFYLRTPSEFRLLDGDKTIVLFTRFLSQLLSAAHLPLSVGIVQTAYANGASTIYIRDVLRIDPVCTPTGVKHLHKAAHDYDIGVYFESNGHGTVLFSAHAQSVIAQALQKAAHESERRALRCLLALGFCVNQYIGDALSAILMVEIALYHLQWDLTHWDGLYEDLPSRMSKVQVKDRNVVVTTDAERKCVKPEGLQTEIDRLVASKEGSCRRAFVRPSGTEDIVRIYAEAQTQKEADELAQQVCDATVKYCNGV